jgi:hypothetical protein
MVEEFAPFGNYTDPDVERALAWFLSFTDALDWEKRTARIEAQLEAVLEPCHSRTDAQIYQPVSIADDRIGWYLYLADTALHAPLKYEPIQGARILPIFKRLGADLDLVVRIRGVEDRVIRMLTSERRQPDSALFELLVALIWSRNGWKVVELLDERPPEKRPDIRAQEGSDEWFIECKRLQKSSDYSENEREKWLRMWVKLRDFLIDRRISAIFDIVFHVELDTLPDDFLLDQLSGKLPLVRLPCEIVSNDTWEVSARPIDYAAAQKHLNKYMVKYPSEQLNELIGGHRDPNQGFTAAVEGRVVQLGEGGGNNRFLDELSFAVGAFWSCDADRAVGRKARDIRRHLAESLRQLPKSGKGVVHIALETLDGTIVEAERYARIVNSLYKFDALDKDLQWVYCHLFQSYAPPHECWVIDETVYYFGRFLGSGVEPLAKRSAIVPDNTDSEAGVHWLREPP